MMKYAISHFYIVMHDGIRKLLISKFTLICTRLNPMISSLYALIVIAHVSYKSIAY